MICSTVGKKKRGQNKICPKLSKGPRSWGIPGWNFGFKEMKIRSKEAVYERQ